MWIEREHCGCSTSELVLVVKNLPANAEERDAGSIPGSGRSPGGRHSNSLQYSCLENPLDRGAWRATVHRVTKSQTRLKWLSAHRHYSGLKDPGTSFALCAHFVNRLHPELHGLLQEHKLELEVTSLPELQHFAEHFERTVEQKKAIRQMNSRWQSWPNFKTYIPTPCFDPIGRDTCNHKGHW